MTTICDDFDHMVDLEASLEPAELAGWREHLETCPLCREQDAAHRALQLALAGTPILEVSPGFEESLRGKLSAVRRGRSPRSRALFFFWLYGTAVALASIMILSSIPWSSGLFSDTAIALTLSGAALTPLLLLLPRATLARGPS